MFTWLTYLLRGIRKVPVWLLAAALAAVACYAVPRAADAYRLLTTDDPAEISDHALATDFNVETARAGIEEALAANDPDLAKNFVDLAAERNVELDPALKARVDTAVLEASSTRHTLKSFASGFIIGQPDDGASLAGTAVGDLFVFGDIRDAVREGGRWAMGQEPDKLVLGLASVGLVITAGTYATAGVTAPVRAGLTLVKAARKAGRLGAGLARSTWRLLHEVVDWTKLRRASGSFSLTAPGASLRAARAAVNAERAVRIVALARDVGKVEAKAGTRAALETLRIAETPAEVGRIAKLAEKEGSRTRAILKVLGRGAIVLITGAFDLALWLFGALVTLLSFVWSLKRTVERMTERYLRRRKERKLRLALAAA